MTDMEIFGKNLKRLRKEQGISAKELAGRTHVSEITIYRYEGARGFRNRPLKAPSFDIVLRLARVFEVSLDEFMKE